jgi:hypothetical protein
MFRCLRSKPFGGTTVILATLPVSSIVSGLITPCDPPDIAPTLGVQTCARMKAGPDFRNLATNSPEPAGPTPVYLKS